MSYITEAGDNFIYFDLDEWDDVAEIVNNDYKSIWEINKKFLDDMVKQKKEFWFSHNPNPGSQYLTLYFKDEVEYIQKLDGFIKFEQVGDYWRAIILYP